MDRLLTHGRVDVGDPLRGVNQLILEARKDLLRPDGRQGAPTERNLFAGASYELEAVSGSTLPGLRFALDRGQWEEAEREATIYVQGLETRVATLRSIREALGALMAGLDGAGE